LLSDVVLVDARSLAVAVFSDAPVLPASSEPVLLVDDALEAPLFVAGAFGDDVPAGVAVFSDVPVLPASSEPLLLVDDALEAAGLDARWIGPPLEAPLFVADAFDDDVPAGVAVFSDVPVLPVSSELLLLVDDALDDAGLVARWIGLLLDAALFVAGAVAAAALFALAAFSAVPAFVSPFCSDEV